jgi:hypothetical protein
MLRRMTTIGLPVILAIFGVIGMAAQASAQTVNGEGTLLVLNENGDPVRRQFSFSARVGANGIVKGNAVLHNPAFDGPNGHGNYQLQISISCMKVVGNVAFLGGTTRRTNDPSVVDAVFFSVQDNGEPGRGKDRISRAFFWDDDPNTSGDPQACQAMTQADAPLETIESGNVQVKP